MNYLKRHWQGELSLAQSFWVNLFLLNLVIRGLTFSLTNDGLIANPATMAQVALTIEAFALLVIYPWQIVGLWRAAQRHIAISTRTFLPRLVMLLIVFSMIGTINQVREGWPEYRDLYQIAFGIEVISDYSLELTSDSRLIHLNGGLAFGVSSDVRAMLLRHPEVEGIILNSIGGRIYEGRELAQLIAQRQLNTYTTEGCYSACGTAFISGTQRFLARGANLGFHQYQSGLLSNPAHVDLSFEQEKDRAVFHKQGVTKEFIDRMFQTSHDDMWIPSVNQLLKSGVVHHLVDASDVLPVQHSDHQIEEIRAAIQDFPAFQMIKQHEPAIYEDMINELNANLSAGANTLQIQEALGQYVQKVAQKLLPKTSDTAIRNFVRQTIYILESLAQVDPVLCIKNLYPEQFGSIDISDHLTTSQMAPMLSAIDQVIIQSMETTVPSVDRPSAQAYMDTVIRELGEDVHFITSHDYQNKQDYAKACNAAIRFYELILNNQDQSANTLRLIFSEV
ncbi:MAG: hypothetical protein C9356_14920 [Oleiphilus sp.]|nr:MAG: hypothetical protein C9356_14920 [Oleiphilus sp.]